MKAENMQFSKLVRLFPIGAFRPEILASKDKRAFFLGHPVGNIDISINNYLFELCHLILLKTNKFDNI